MKNIPAIIILLFLVVSCQSEKTREEYNHWKAAEPKNANESLLYLLEKSKARVIIDGMPLTLTTSLWVNLMPGSNMRGGLMVNVAIKDARIKKESQIPPYPLLDIESDCLWLIYRHTIIWKTTFRDEMKPEISNYGGVARGGPVMTAKDLTAIVRIKYKKKTYYLMQTSIEVMSVM